MKEPINLGILAHHFYSTQICIVQFVGSSRNCISWSCSVIPNKLSSPWCHYSMIDDCVHFNCAKFTHTYSYQYR